MKWPTSLKSEIPNEFWAQEGERNFTSNLKILPRSFLETSNALRNLYEFHNEHVRNWVKQHPSHTLIEVDITHNDTGKILANAFGLNETCWGHMNQNKKKNKRKGKPLRRSKFGGGGGGMFMNSLGRNGTDGVPLMEHHRKRFRQGFGGRQSMQQGDPRIPQRKNKLSQRLRQTVGADKDSLEGQAAGYQEQVDRYKEARRQEKGNQDQEAPNAPEGAKERVMKRRHKGYPGMRKQKAMEPQR
jgi:hypothetical protein